MMSRENIKKSIEKKKPLGTMKTMKRVHYHFNEQIHDSYLI